MTATSTQATDTAPRSATETLRGNCMGAAILLIVQYAVGMGVNLYVTIPSHKSFLPAVFGSVLLAVHAIIALGLLAAAISAVVRSVKTRRLIPLTVTGLAAIIGAAFAGSAFVGSGADGASLAMALATAVAMACYLLAVFRLRVDKPSP